MQRYTSVTSASSVTSAFSSANISLADLLLVPLLEVLRNDVIESFLFEIRYRQLGLQPR